MKTISLILSSGCLVIIAGVLSMTSGVWAQNQQPTGHDLHIEHDVRVQEDEDGITARHTHTVTVENTTRAALETLQYALGASEVTDLSVAYGDGTEISYATAAKRTQQHAYVFDYTELLLDFPREAEGTGERFSFEITYDTAETVKGTGDNRVVLVPMLDGNVDAGWELGLTVPSEWPEVNYSPDVDAFSQGSTERVFRFQESDTGENLLGLSFAASALYDVEQTAVLKNRSLLPRYRAVMIPADLHNQHVHVQSLDPQPDRVQVDKDGNIRADYWLWPRQQHEIRASVRVRVEQLRYDPKEAGDIADTPDGFESYVIGDRRWPTQSQVGEQATRLIDPDADAWENVRHIHDFVAEEIRLADNEDIDSTEAAFSERKGSAEQVADVLVTMLRSQGVPARVIEGVNESNAALVNAAGTYAWVEAYIPGMGWVTLDPLWASIFDSFGYSGADRIGIRAISNERQRDRFTSGTSYHLDVAVADEELPEIEEPLQVRARSYVVLPGLVLDAFTVQNTSGYVVDEVMVGEKRLGALAPLAQTTNRQWRAGSMSGFTSRVTNPHQDNPVAFVPVWWPLGVSALVVLGTGAGLLYWRRVRRYRNQRLHGRTHT